MTDPRTTRCSACNGAGQIAGDEDYGDCYACDGDGFVVDPDVETGKIDFSKDDAT